MDKKIKNTIIGAGVSAGAALLKVIWDFIKNLPR